MAVTQDAVLSGLRVLVCIAKADGVLHDEEKKALASALESAPLPEGTTLETLLDEEIDLDRELGILATAESREEVFKSAYTIANVDGQCSPEEQKMLDRIQKRLGVSKQKRTLIDRVLSEAKDTVLPSNITPVADASRRDVEIQQDTLKYAVLSALLGAFPVPGLAIATDLAVVALQVKLVRDVGQYWGHTVDKQAAKSMLYGLGLGTGARMAVNNLVKLLPGWGSAVGAATSFASTYALGKVMNQFFSSAQASDVSSLEHVFKSAEKEGKAVYEQNKAAIAAKQAANKASLEKLNAALKAGKIDQAEYERRAAELA